MKPRSTINKKKYCLHGDFDVLRETHLYSISFSSVSLVAKRYQACVVTRAEKQHTLEINQITFAHIIVFFG